MGQESDKKKNSQSKTLTRRSFLGTTATAAAAFTILPRYVMGGKGYTAPSDMINVAGIGVGSQGGGDIQQLCTPDVPIVRHQRYFNGTPMTKEQSAAQEARMAEMMKRMAPKGGTPGANTNAVMQMGAAGNGKPIKLATIYALCDVDHDYAGHIIKGYPKAKLYNDWRELLDKEKSIDAVVIGTPDHNHAMIAAAFMRAKKHVYLEKPMAKTIFEVRKLASLAKETGVVTQMGNQGHATEGTRRTVEFIQSGVIGPERLHFNWRGLWDYGTGAMGDMGAHIFDAPIWSLNLGMPTKIQATSSPYSTD